MTRDHNLTVIAKQFSDLENETPDARVLSDILGRSRSVETRAPKGLVGGVDSSDNLLLNLPNHPGAAVAGYSHSLVLCDPDGRPRHANEHRMERDDETLGETLGISLVHNLPTPNAQRQLHIANYQLSQVLPTPSGRSPYSLDGFPPEFKVRYAAAQQREVTERRSTFTALYQFEGAFGLLLKDGRLASQNVSTRFTDDLGRRAVERSVRYVGVVKMGSDLWSRLYPFHKAVYRQRGAYWAVIPPGVIAETYTRDQIEVKTLRLGAQENQALGGIGGAWVMYGNGDRSFYILEFNVYDLEEYRPLVDRAYPLEEYNRERQGWTRTYVARASGDEEHVGTQTRITQRDLEELVAPTVGEIHHLALASRISPGYPVALAHAHNRCKITRERKDRENAKLIAELTRHGFQVADFEQWNEDPHKVFQN